jgi:hypothetical protein
MKLSPTDKSLRAWLLAIVVVHFVVTLWHRAAHEHIPVPLSALQTAFVVVVIDLLPLVGACLLWTKYRCMAALILAGSMFASLIFGLINHFVLESPDNVTSLPEHEWRHSFIASAILIEVIEAIGAAMGFVAAKKWWHADSHDIKLG